MNKILVEVSVGELLDKLTILEIKKDKIKDAKKLKFIKHNPSIGGRFSVFSNVGMLPAYLMGLKIKKFKKETVKFLKNNKMEILVLKI